MISSSAVLPTCTKLGLRPLASSCARAMRFLKVAPLDRFLCGMVASRLVLVQEGKHVRLLSVKNPKFGNP